MAQNQQRGAGGGGGLYADYVPVAERIEKFYQAYPTGRITTSILEHDRESGFVLIRAEVYRTTDDAQPAATGHAFEVRGESYVNRTSYIENGESSAVGRALALLGFEVKRGANYQIASREEMEKSTRAAAATATPNVPAAATPNAAVTSNAASRARAFDEGEDGAVSQTSSSATAAAQDTEAISDHLDAEILEAASALGYDAAKVRNWANKKYGVSGGLESLTMQDKREVLNVFRAQLKDKRAKKS